MGRYGRRHHLFSRLLVESCGADMLRPAGGVLGIEVVELASGHDFNDRQREGLVVAEHRDGQFGSFDELLHYHAVINFEDLFHGICDGVGPFDDIDAEGAALGGRFYHTGAAHDCCQLLGRIGLTFLHVLEGSGGNAGAVVEELRLGLVHGRRARPHARARVGEADSFQKTLEHAVLAALAVKAEEGDIEGLFDQSLQVVLVSWVELIDGEARLAQRLSGALSRCQGYFALAAGAPGEQRDTAGGGLEGLGHGTTPFWTKNIWGAVYQRGPTDYNGAMNNELIKLSQDELTDRIVHWGFPRFRGKQVYEWIHRHHASSYDDMRNVPKDLRERLSREFPETTIAVVDRQVSSDGTRKYVLRLADGALVETVGMPVYREDGSVERLTVCVSSQVGCPMGCAFCATGREGLTRNLAAAELVSQVALVQEDFGERVSNVVVMGQGEPFLNYDEVLAGLRILNSPDDFNIGARHITISTCGLLDGIEHLSLEPEQFTLAVSLHAAQQLTRDALMPRVSNQPLADLKQSLLKYTKKTNRRVSLEYLLIKDVNDGEEDLEALLDFCDGLLCHVNLLPMNPIEGALFQPTSDKRGRRWKEALEAHGIETSFRKSRGSDIAGACGQLKNKVVSR